MAQLDSRAAADRGGPQLDTTTAARLGASIRERRHAQSLTLVQLAEQTGLSHSFLSQIERGLAQPSMKSLYGIAGALGTTQDRLMTAATPGAAASEVLVLRADEGVTLRDRDRDGDPAEQSRQGSARLLLADPGVYYPTEFAGLGRDFGEMWYQHDGSEFAYVAEGVIEVELGDGTVHRLGPGDSMRYPGTMAHRWRATSRGATRALMVHSGVHSGLPQ